MAVLAFDGVVLSDLATPSDLFGRVRDSKGRPLYEVRVCGCRRRVASEHLTLEVRSSLTTLERADTVIVPGIEPIDRAVPEELICGAAARSCTRGARVVPICCGAFVLARTGALKGIRTTTHWLAAEELARRYPEIHVNPDVLDVDNGKILTSAGAAAGLDLCLHLVRRDLGADVAARTVRLAVMPLARAGGQARFIVHEASAVNDRTAMGTLLLLDREKPAQTAVALRDCSSGRHEHKNSQQAIRRARGRNTGPLLAAARVRHAPQLLETTSLSVEEIALQSGFRFGVGVAGISQEPWARRQSPTGEVSGLLEGLRAGLVGNCFG